MIEIIAMIAFYRGLKSTLQDKDLPTDLAAIGPLFWILGEVVGFMAFGGIAGEVTFNTYIYALIGGFVGAMFAFVIVKSRPAKKVDVDRYFPTDVRKDPPRR